MTKTNRILAVMLSTIVTLCFTGIIASAEDDYTITNGDFEDEVITSIPGWSIYGGSLGTEVSVVEGGNTGSGNCLQMVKGSAALGANSAKVFDFSAGEPYGISVWALNASSTGIYVKIDLYDGTSIQNSTKLGDTVTKTVSTSASWQKVDYMFLAPAGCKMAAVYLCNYSATTGATVYFDNLIFEKRSFISNGNFESSGGTIPTGWGINGSSTTWYTSADSEGAHSGSSYVKIDGTGNPSLYYAGVPVTTSTRYKLSFFYKYNKKSQDGAPRLTVNYNTNAASAWGTSLYTTSTATYANSISPWPENTWIKCTYYFTTPSASCSYLAIHLIGYSNWISCYDDIVFEKDNVSTVELCQADGDQLTALKNGTITAKSRYIPAAGETSVSATLVEAVYRNVSGVKTLVSVSLATNSTATGQPFNIITSQTISDKTNLTVEAYLWNNLNDLIPLTAKASVS